MNYLLDENISWRVCQKIKAFYPNCIHVNEIFEEDSPTDKSIWEFAKRHECVIVSIDNDFSELSRFHRTLPKIIHLNVHNKSNNEIAQKLINAYPKIDQFVQDPSIFLLIIY